MRTEGAGFCDRTNDLLGGLPLRGRRGKPSIREEKTGAEQGSTVYSTGKERNFSDKLGKKEFLFRRKRTSDWLKGDKTPGKKLLGKKGNRSIVEGTRKERGVISQLRVKKTFPSIR